MTTILWLFLSLNSFIAPTKNIVRKRKAFSLCELKRLKLSTVYFFRERTNLTQFIMKKKHFNWLNNDIPLRHETKVVNRFHGYFVFFFFFRKSSEYSEHVWKWRQCIIIPFNLARKYKCSSCWGRYGTVHRLINAFCANGSHNAQWKMWF